GPDTIFVARFSGVSLMGGAKMEDLLKRPNVTPADAAALERMAPSIEMVDIILGQGGGGSAPRDRVYYKKDKTKMLQIFGTTDRYPSITKIPVVIGRFYTESEVQLRKPVIVLGQTPYTALFPNVDPIGKHVRLGLQDYEVIGVMDKRPSPGGFSI